MYNGLVTETKRKHLWSGWPGAFCFACGLEDATELAQAGTVKEVRHRYSGVKHTEQPCGGCSDDERGCDALGW